MKKEKILYTNRNEIKGRKVCFLLIFEFIFLFFLKFLLFSSITLLVFITSSVYAKQGVGDTTLANSNVTEAPEAPETEAPEVTTVAR